MTSTVILALGLEPAFFKNHSPAWQSAGFFLTSAWSVEEAVNLFHDNDFDVVLLGHSIPFESRERLAFLIRASGSQIPVVCVEGPSGNVDPFADAMLKSDHDVLIPGIARLLTREARKPVARASAQPIRQERRVAVSYTNLNGTGAAMYTTKPMGSFAERRGDIDHELHALKHDSIHHDLCRALDRNEMTLYYQPKIDMKTGAAIGSEALSRWLHPTRGSVPAMRFIPIAEESDLIVQIGAWALREACIQARNWNHAGLPEKTVAVNVSTVQLLKQGFVESLLTILSETGIDAACLELDVTMSSLLKHFDETRRVLASLRKNGIHVTADNVGQSYPNFSMLKNSYVDALKIDRTFVQRISNHPEDRTKVSSMINVGHQMKLRVIAEGVETVEHLEFLWEHGCDEAQGYYFDEPMPPEMIPFRSTRNRGVQASALT